MKKSKIITTIVVILLVIAMLFVYKTYSPKTVAGAKEITIVVNHLNGDKKTFDIKTDEEYLRGALEQENLISGSQSSYGFWLEGVDGEIADASKEEWWGYTQDGQFAEYGLDQKPIADGDIYEFTLYVGYENYN